LLPRHEPRPQPRGDLLRRRGPPLTDADNNVTTFAYDADNRKTSQTDPLGKSTTFAYDAAGNLTSTGSVRSHAHICDP
jgi:YD repeat-containing protein